MSGHTTTVAPDGTITVTHGGAVAETSTGPLELAPGLASMSLLKAAEESRFTLGVAYPVNKLDVAKARDGKRDFAPPAVVERAAWDWMLKSQDIGLFHESGTEGHGRVVENYIWRWGDLIKADADTAWAKLSTGDWLLGVLWDRPAWTLVKSLMVRGYSPQGRAQRVPASPEALAQLRS